MSRKISVSETVSCMNGVTREKPCFALSRSSFYLHEKASEESSFKQRGTGINKIPKKDLQEGIARRTRHKEKWPSIKKNEERIVENQE